MPNEGSIVKRRPAETGSLAGGVVILIAYFAGLDDPLAYAALGMVVSGIPAGITWLVELIRRPH